MTEEVETNAVVLAEAKLAELEARLSRARAQAEGNRTKGRELAYDIEELLLPAVAAAWRRVEELLKLEGN